MTIQADKHRCKHFPYANKSGARTTANRETRHNHDDISHGGVWRKEYKRHVRWDIW